MGLKFEELEIWIKTVDFTKEVHNLTRSFPKEELHILTSQIKKASDSVALHIAEGSMRKSSAEFRQFIIYARMSAVEVVACLYIGKKRRIVHDEVFDKLYREAQEIIKALHALEETV